MVVVQVMQLVAPYAAAEKILMMTRKSQALIEFRDVYAAEAVVTNLRNPMIRGQ